MAQKSNVKVTGKSVSSLPKGVHTTGSDGKMKTVKGAQNTKASTNKAC